MRQRRWKEQTMAYRTEGEWKVSAKETTLRLATVTVVVALVVMAVFSIVRIFG